MQANPYQPPSGDAGPSRSVPWKRGCLIGGAAMLVSMVVLYWLADFQGAGVRFDSAWAAMLLLGMFCLGAMTLIGSGIGWLVTAALRRKQNSRRP
jgi:hypothetical protein